jgi:hypothetical protein
MSPKHVGDLLDRIGCLNHACDLDLLLFFHRHPRVVLTSERLATYIGHDLSRVAQSLDTLIGAGLLSRTQRPGGVERMYALVIVGPQGGWLDALLHLASTREGRLAVLAVLARPQPEGDSPETGGLGPRAACPQHARAASESKEVRHA